METRGEGQTEPQRPSCVDSIFQQPWWLEAVAPGRWGEALVTRGDEVAARMPYVIKKKYGLVALTQPPLTQNLGPWLRPSGAKYANQLAEQKDLMRALIEQLPGFDLFRQNFSPVIANWLPFYWAGFDATVGYTYRIEDLTDLDLIWQGFRDSIRRGIRKARRAVAVRDDLGAEKCLDLVELTFRRQERKLPFSRDVALRLDSACARHGARRILFAQDAQGRIHAALYLVWDDRAAYYLMGGGDPDLRSSGATSLLMWEAIQFASTVTRVFDFEGSMVESIERFFRSFGARQTPYFQVTKMSRRMRLLTASKDLCAALVGRA